ncbi:hypothetical protein MPH_00010 [Macrophomina phaseolina MS6]|uniref:Uncharacterized protein n=1 Tax=Macrophomina phaseolina (strain MS6) TaxID=1126212 RepID=K2RJA4_MACPH|nr:hypothetical protein MPH_00010 [Macrophomina phaseolina MS6]
MAPPMGGPTTVPSAARASNRPRYLDRSSSGTMSEHTTSAKTAMPPPPIPWTTRPPTMMPMFWAAPQRALPAAKSRTQPSTVAFRSKKSASWPTMSRKTEHEREYPLTIQVYSLVSNEREIVGSAIVITVESSAERNITMHREAKTAQKPSPMRVLPGGPLLSCSVDPTGATSGVERRVLGSKCSGGVEDIAAGMVLE